MAKCSFFVNQLLFLIECHAVQPIVEVIEGNMGYSNIFKMQIVCLITLESERFSQNSKICPKIWKNTKIKWQCPNVTQLKLVKIILMCKLKRIQKVSKEDILTDIRSFILI